MNSWNESFELLKSIEGSNDLNKGPITWAAKHGKKLLEFLGVLKKPVEKTPTKLRWRGKAKTEITKPRVVKEYENWKDAVPEDVRKRHKALQDHFHKLAHSVDYEDAFMGGGHSGAVTPTKDAIENLISKHHKDIIQYPEMPRLKQYFKRSGGKGGLREDLVSPGTVPRQWYPASGTKPHTTPISTGKKGSSGE